MARSTSYITMRNGYCAKVEERRFALRRASRGTSQFDFVFGFLSQQLQREHVSHLGWYGVTYDLLVRASV